MMAAELEFDKETVVLGKLCALTAYAKFAAQIIRVSQFLRRERERERERERVREYLSENTELNPLEKTFTYVLALQCMY